MSYFPYGGKPVTEIASGGNILTFQQYLNAAIDLSAPKGVPNSIANFDGRAMAGFAPLDPPLVAWITSVSLFKQWHYDRISPFCGTSPVCIDLLKICANTSPI